MFDVAMTPPVTKGDFVAAVCSKMLSRGYGWCEPLNNINMLGENWLGNLHSNQDRRSQSPLFYH